MKKKGGVINTVVANVTTKALISKSENEHLKAIDLKSSLWAKSLFKRMGFVKRACTTGRPEIPAGARKEAELVFHHKIVTLSEKYNIPLKEIAMKDIHVMSALLLQKTSKTSKSKDRVKTLERRLNLWQNGEVNALLDKSLALQERLPKPSGKKDISVISKQFKDLMQKGNVNGAIKNKLKGGVLPLNDETLNSLAQKHPNTWNIL